MTTFKKIPASKKSLNTRKLIHGIGINNSIYMTTTNKKSKAKLKSYEIWASMIQRCYDEKTMKRHETYRDCYVCNEWLTFSNFAEWFDEKYIKGLDLDKDIKIKGNKVYGPDTCLFLPRCINTLLVSDKKRRGNHPIGVCFDKSRGKFISHVKIDGKNKHLGRFSGPELAYSAYVKAKNAEIMRKCEQYPEFAKYLINHLLEV